MGLSPTNYGWLRDGLGNKAAADAVNALLGYGVYGTTYYVDTFNGGTSNDGLSWDSALSTMAAALTLAQTGDTILFRGNVREQLVGSNLKFDITIRGVGSLHHPDQPAATYDYGAAMWRAPASPTAATPLLEVRGRGWKFENIAWDGPSDAACVLLKRNALSGVSEYDASHASFAGCRWLASKYHIEDSGGCYNVTVDGNQFAQATTAAIANTSTAVANPLNWKILGNQFPANTSSFGNATHIDSPLNCAVIAGNYFGTVTSTALYVDLTGGNTNIVTGNYCMGSYDTSDYVAGTGDGWSGNITADISGNSSVDASGLTIAAPGAP